VRPITRGHRSKRADAPGDEEIDLLLRRLARAEAGDGQVVLVSGEPGLGKSCITAALEERLHAQAAYPCALFLLALSSG
jgi:predicted ATPase